MDKIASKEVGFYANMAADPGTPTYESSPDWQLLACTTSKGWNSDLDTIETVSDCDDGASSIEAGDITWQFNNSFYVVKEPDSGQISTNTLTAVHKAKEKRQFKLESIDDNGATYYRMGYGLITNISNTVDAGNYMTGDMTVTGSGDYEDTIGS